MSRQKNERQVFKHKPLYSHRGGKVQTWCQTCGVSLGKQDDLRSAQAVFTEHKYAAEMRERARNLRDHYARR